MSDESTPPISPAETPEPASPPAPKPAPFDLKTAEPSPASSGSASGSAIESRPPAKIEVGRYAIYGLTFFVPTIWHPVDLDVVSRMQQVVTTPRDQTEIHWWLYSGGGSADATYKLAYASHRLAKKTVIVIPYWAKSAATLLALTGHEIYMDLNSELGPLDAQIPHPDREVHISVLDILGSLSFMSGKSIEMMGAGLGSMIAQSALDTESKIEQLREYSEGLLEPFLQKIDPILLTRAFSALKIANEYGMRILNQRAVPAEQQQKMLARLVGNYPSHGFVINMEEAAELGFPVKPLADYKYRDQAMGAFQEYFKGLAGSGDGRSLIQMTQLNSPSDVLRGKTL